MSLAPFVAALGRGPGRSRSLTREEAAEALGLMLAGGAAPEATGALLMLLRMKGETPDEIAGFAVAAQATLRGLPQVDLDWPSYAAGRTRGLPWFLLSARIVAMAGYRVLLHGRNGSDGSVRAHLRPAGIAVARCGGEADRALRRGRPVYMPLEDLHPALDRLLDLRAVLGLRSCINTVCRMLNPAAAPGSVQGVFHPSYRLLQSEAASLLGWRSLTVIKGGGGEFERNPAKPLEVFGLRAGAAFETTHPGGTEVGRRLSDVPAGITLDDLWSGRACNAFAEAIVVGTAGLALDTLGLPQPAETALRLWTDRPRSMEDAA